jgi:hypothetical protein
LGSIAAPAVEKTWPVPLSARPLPDCGERECYAAVPAEPDRPPQYDYTGLKILGALVLAALIIDLILQRTGHRTESEGVRHLGKNRPWFTWLVSGALVFLIVHFWP